MRMGIVNNIVESVMEAKFARMGKKNVCVKSMVEKDCARPHCVRCRQNPEVQRALLTLLCLFVPG